MGREKQPEGEPLPHQSSTFAYTSTLNLENTIKPHLNINSALALRRATVPLVPTKLRPDVICVLYTLQYIYIYLGHAGHFFQSFSDNSSGLRRVALVGETHSRDGSGVAVTQRSVDELSRSNLPRR